MKEGNFIRTPSLRELTRTFLHLGSTAYGGLAMVEPIRRLVVQKKGWLSQPDFLDGLALCQLLPGATVVQLATYVGYRLRRTAGALAAAAAFILPAFVLILGLSALYFEYGELTWAKAMSRGFNAVIIALLLQALWRFKEILRRHWLEPGIGDGSSTARFAQTLGRVHPPGFVIHGSDCQAEMLSRARLSSQSNVYLVGADVKAVGTRARQPIARANQKTGARRTIEMNFISLPQAGSPGYLPADCSSSP